MRMKALLNGKIYSSKGFYEAVLIENGKIKALGKNDQIKKMISAEDEQLDLNGRLVLPGFIDSHAHGPFSLSKMVDRIDLYSEDTEEGYIEIVRKFVEENPDKEVYSGMGWINPAFDKLGPDKKSLDRVCSDKPVILQSGDGHSVWGNSRAIELAGVSAETPDPEGGTIERDTDGSPRGAFREQAQDMLRDLIPEPTIEEYKKSIMLFQDMMASYGHTAVFDPMVDLDSNMLEAYRELDREGMLKIKFGLAYLSAPENPELLLERCREIPRFNSGKLIEGTFVKVFVDGVVEGGTAYLKEAYCNRPGYFGKALWSQDKLNRFCEAVDKAGYDIHFHVIGDAAVKQMIDAMDHVKKANGERLRNTVAAHMQIVDVNDYEKLKELDIRISSNPYWFVKAPGYYEDIELPSLGDRAEREYPMKAFFDMGLTVSAGSDFAVTPEPFPMRGIQLAMLRTIEIDEHNAPQNILGAEESIDFEQGLEAFTANGSKTMGIDGLTGVIEVGKCADLAVMEQNVLEMEPWELEKTCVYMTFSDGEMIYCRNQDE